jgi:alkylation response protein AidB-like acyl-CoA dehydrogenase
MSIVQDITDVAGPFAERDAADPESFPHENIDDLKRAGIPAAMFPRSLGGRDASLADAVRVVEAVARRSPPTALLLAMPLGLPGSYVLALPAVPERHRPDWLTQTERLASDFAQGLWYAACNSEKGAGGSILATKTQATREADGWRIDGQKILASGGRYADCFFSSARVSEDDVPGTAGVEMFYVRTDAPGVTIMDDWNGFGMRSTESQSVTYEGARAEAVAGFPDYLQTLMPFLVWYHLFPAISLGCASSLLDALATPAPQSQAMRLRLSEALMRVEAMRGYLLQTAAEYRPGKDAAYAARVVRTKTYVTQESTKLCAEVFALSGGRHYSRGSALARTLADSFAGTALRPPLALALDMMVEQFGT